VFDDPESPGSPASPGLPGSDLPPQVTVYTDGGADPNPGPGGWGVVLLHGASGKHAELSGGEPQTTNNRMELTAAIRALEALQRRSAVRLFTDSQYLRKGVTEWLPGWILRGFRRKEGVLQNEDLWRRLAELIRLHDIHWQWVKGHAGNRWNERADQLATAAIHAQHGAAPKPVCEAEIFLRVATAGRSGGWAALVRNGGEEKVLTGSAQGVTSNALDVLGAAEALERLPEGATVAVYTGSDYLRNGATKWLPAWQKRGWRTQEGDPVKNRDIWERLARAMAKRKVEWPVCKGAPPPELKDLGKTAAEAAGKG
jgi:ribonuclease HI